MTYPNPEYKASIDVGSTKLNEGRGYLSESSNQDRFNSATRAIMQYLRNNTYHFHGSSEGADYTFKKQSGLTPEGIVIHCVGNYTTDWVPDVKDLQIELLSFTTPVDGLVEKLKTLIKDAAHK